MPKGTYIVRGKQGWQQAKTQTFNFDNGSGTTVDDVLLANLPFDIEIMSAQVVYTEATDTTGAASANVKIGTTAGGNGIVAATNYEVSKAVGGTTALTIVSGVVAAGSSVFVRHTGRAATEAGQGYVQIFYRVRSA